MGWTKIDFGEKHIGKTLPQVLFTDPDWFFFCMKKDVFRNKRAFAEEARELNTKARRIRIPQDKFEDPVAVYIIHRPTRKFDRVKVCSRNGLEHQQSDFAYVMDVFDLSIPHQISEFDKTGNRNLLSFLKHYLFDDESYHMTKKRCEKFFEDDSNFDLVSSSVDIGVN